MTALTAEDFAALMGGLGPFEPKPRLAVALSGGADSLALTLLLKRWLDQRGGSLLALTVDHGLRPGLRAGGCDGCRPDAVYRRSPQDSALAGRKTERLEPSGKGPRGTL